MFPAVCSDYTHVIIIGGIELFRVLQAAARYALGGEGYVDPVAFENVFEVVDGIPTPTFEPVVTVRGWFYRRALSLCPLI